MVANSENQQSINIKIIFQTELYELFGFTLVFLIKNQDFLYVMAILTIELLNKIGESHSFYSPPPAKVFRERMINRTI